MSRYPVSCPVERRNIVEDQDPGFSAGSDQDPAESREPLVDQGFRSGKKMKML